MQIEIRTQRAYYLGTALFALLTALLRTLALTLALNKTSGYFYTNALTVCYRTVAGLSLVAILLFPLLALKDRVSPDRAGHTHGSICAAGICALLSFLNFICGCTLKNEALPSLLWLVGLLSLLAAVIYFILQAAVCKASVGTHAVLGCLTIIGFACLVAFTYFDIGTPMNVPRKTDLHMALLAIMLYLIYELRAKAGIPLPRMLTACSALAFFLAATVGFSNLVAFLAGIYTDPLYLVQDLMLIAAATYIGARSAADAALAAQKLTGKDDTV